MDTQSKVWIGIDVSKETLEVCSQTLQGKPKRKTFDNTAAGFSKLLRWIRPLYPEASLHFTLEATGAYSDGIAFFLVEAEEKVSVLNPARIKFAASGWGVGNKTDKVDAHTIATFCRKEEPPPWAMATPEARLLTGLVRRVVDLKQSRVQEQNRLQVPGLPAPVLRSVQRSIRFLDKQIEEHIDRTPSLKADRDLLLSIPGIAETTAAAILAELPDVTQFEDGRSAAAYAGLNPREHPSGSSVKRRTRLSKRGNAALRCALYMPAMTAVQWNVPVKALYDRLKARGLCPKAALGAAMRKLLMIAVGVLKSRVKFDPQWQGKKKLQTAS